MQPAAGEGSGAPSGAVFDVLRFGAVGDGVADDTAAIQRAIDAAAAVGSGARVLVPPSRTYRVGAITLRGGIDFHLAGDARLTLDTRPEAYASADVTPLQSAGVQGSGAALYAYGAEDLRISGTGSIDGRAAEFMERYDAAGEWWVPKGFRPRLLVLENCARLTIRDVTLRDAPSWTVHLLGCRQVLIDGVHIRNRTDVPNCDGIAPDHCQHVVIRRCRITCGDDAIVIKTTAGNDRYGPSRDIHVHDCVLETQDAGLKIGTETHQDVHDVLFERCRILKSGRALSIQLRDGGNVHHVTFRDIAFDAQCFAPPWWGRGEAISFTAIPRDARTTVGTIHDIRVDGVRGTAENSLRVDGLGGGRLRDVVFERVTLAIGRRTRHAGAGFDNRPTRVVDEIEVRGMPGASVRHAERVRFHDCEIRWLPPAPEYATHLLDAEDAPRLDAAGLAGEPALPDLPPTRIVR